MLLAPLEVDAGRVVVAKVTEPLTLDGDNRYTGKQVAQAIYLQVQYLQSCCPQQSILSL